MRWRRHPHTTRAVPRGPVQRPEADGEPHERHRERIRRLVKDGLMHAVQGIGALCGEAGPTTARDELVTCARCAHLLERGE